MSSRAAATTARLLRSAAHCFSGSASVSSGAAAAAGGTRLETLLALRGLATTAAQSSGRAQQLGHRCAAAAAGAAVRASSGGIVAAAATAWGPVAAAAARQQARGYARFLQFQPRPQGGGGWSRLGGGMDSADRVLWGLIGANVAGFLLWRTHPAQMNTHATVSIDGLRSGRVWTAVTAAFSHRDLSHLGANMIGLFFFGRDVGRLFGGKKLLLLYLAGGVAGSLAHCGFYYYKSCQTGEGRFGRARWFGFTPSALGASAAVNAIMCASILLNPTATVLLYGIIPMPAALLGVLWLLQDVSGAYGGGTHIANAGHLGGAATGLAFYLLFRLGRLRPRGWY